MVFIFGPVGVPVHESAWRGKLRPAAIHGKNGASSGDSDTRVTPLHVRKMTALMQASNEGNRPVLLHYTTAGGRSAGVSLKQSIAGSSDELAFLWDETSAR